MNEIKNYPQKNFTHAIVAVDAVLFTVIKEKLNVLLVQLKNGELDGKWALPGGLVKVDESLEMAAERHLTLKTNIKNAYIEQLYTFGDVNRDAYGRVVSVAYFALVNSSELEMKTTDRYNAIKWFDVKTLPDLAYDHGEIIRVAVKRLRTKLYYSNIVYSLLPKEFTLTDIQRTFESIVGEKLDKRNFRRKITATGLLKESGDLRTGFGYRPAILYAFKDKKYKEVDLI